jgi:flagellar biosynthesis protein FlhB
MTDIESFFVECLKEAVKNGELPKSADLEDAAVSLMTILTGTLLATKFSDNDNGNIMYHYKRQLRILWNGIGAKNS